MDLARARNVSRFCSSIATLENPSILGSPGLVKSFPDIAGMARDWTPGRADGEPVCAAVLRAGCPDALMPCFPFPVDLLVRTPEQIEQRLAMGDPFILDVTSQGKVLYEAAHNRMG